MKLTPVSLLVSIALSFCGGRQQATVDLAITNVAVFNSKQKTVLKQKTILVNADSIVAVVDNLQDIRAVKTIFGNGRLAVPGFVDTHIHLTHTFGDARHAPDSLSEVHRHMLSETYLKYGTTTVVEMGQTPKWIPYSIEWQKDPDPSFPNLYISGGALISDLERPVAFTHEEVSNPEEARKKVQEYARRGIKHVKLYSYLDEPEFSAAVKEAKRHGLTISGHIDRGGVTILDAMESGVQNFEHLLSLATNVIDFHGHSNDLIEKYHLGRIRTIDQWVAVMIFYFEFIEENPELKMKLNQLLDKMAKKRATLSTTIHQMGAVAEETHFFTSFGEDDQQVLRLPGYTAAHKFALKKAFAVLMKILKRAHEKGVKLRIGTDSRRGGEALHSELLLLYEHGFSVEDILQIATINGAEAMDLDDRYGQIAKGKKADILLFEANPFDDYQNFLAKKTVIKGGLVFLE